MSASATNLVPVSRLRSSSTTSSQEVVCAQISHELVFGVVGHIGSGASVVANKLKTKLEAFGYIVHIAKASEVILEWARANAMPIPSKHQKHEKQSTTFEYISKLQNFGDEMRRESEDHAAVARRLISKIRELRAKDPALVRAGSPVEPDGQKRAYILDSIRHPTEVDLLRHVYRSAFVLIGVVCDEEERIKRITKKLYDAGEERTKDIMRRDAKAKEKWGQRVSDAFHLADVFLDNSTNQIIDSKGQKEPNPNWEIPDQLDRLVTLITRQKIPRATQEEAAMYIAYGAQMRSACLSRQVGASLIDKNGNTIATGTNDVPKAGGGLYRLMRHNIPHTRDKSPPDLAPDHRCAYYGDEPHCRNTREQKEIIGELSQLVEPHIKTLSNDLQRFFIEKLKEKQQHALVEELSTLSDEHAEKLLERALHAIADELPSSRIGGLLEFSRAVHAEMDAVLAAARSGASIVGGRLYVTTFPCHYCARHLVAAGIDEVQYIEPYPKSRALKLHADAITTSNADWTPPSQGGQQVLIRPFTGIAPRLYERVFLKVGELKDEKTGDMKIADLPWGDRWNAQKISYAQLEAELTREIEEKQSQQVRP